ncbi:nickel-dependent lactate racemase [Desulfovibrio litoralis]|uniref:nickel-dependent lactate racemase n=1 Tax=Desulfovibrio litoralis TaxID=466107 RepID=UPI0009332355|nr:nickel-dependent lactate racemase [Desulfovibrio litoralis]
MDIKLKYGSDSLVLNIPDSISVDIFEPNEASPLADPLAAFLNALDAMDGSAFTSGSTPKSVAIAVPDETRPLPIKLFLPVLIERILKTFPSLKVEDISIVVGGGLHPPADSAQLQRILPSSLLDGSCPCKIVCHDAKNSPMTYFGETSRGTPVEVNAAIGTADLKIVMGMIDVHQFVGFTGGSKGVAIGCASARMITANHKMLAKEGASAANIESNPVRQDLNEAGELIGVNLAINVVLDASKKPVIVLAGKPVDVMKAGAVETARIYGLKMKEPYDIVIASCGGNPKDICLYQAQKGLTPAAQACKEGGKILILAECSQGIGDDVYHDYVKQFPCPHALMKAFQSSEFRMGAHKAFLFARVTTKKEVVFHTALDEKALSECLLKKGEAQATLNQWIKELKSPRIAVLKNANSSFFSSNE